MTYKPASLISALAVLGTALTLTSCTVQDPLFAADSGRIADIAYPANQIVGLWVSVDYNTVQDSTHADTKSYYDIRPNGQGGVRQSSFYRATGHSLSLEANFHWQYLGRNRWIISLPGSSSYKVTENNGHLTTGHSDPGQLTARYYNDKLYLSASKDGFSIGIVWVRGTAENVAASIHRARNEPLILGLGSGDHPLIEVIPGH